MRSMTWKRKLGYAIIRPIVKLLLSIFWWTCRVEKIIGDEHAQKLIDKGEPIIPCYWHQMHIFGSWYMRKLQKRGLKIGFLISPSVDGEVPAKIIESWGAVAIRGSSNRTGARALKDMYNTIVKDKISPVTTSDGPTGPVHEFKQGAVMLAQLTQSPMLPIAYMASRYWESKSWDKFIIPKPFSRIVIAVGEPHSIDKKSNAEKLEEERVKMETAMNNLIEVARAAL
ncbi:MAG: lysophospholipid acyltransferase family protein [Gammaproteobacteria bacterium]|nr:lysophospholipid acyltransferase family protein [Gammaproteobacteria bacterium]MDH5659552.1 lysophospholipid acyltransferase family protein [Gammaproteobacteria bacterium]